MGCIEVRNDDFWLVTEAFEFNPVEQVLTNYGVHHLEDLAPKSAGAIRFSP